MSTFEYTHNLKFLGILVPFDGNFWNKKRAVDPNTLPLLGTLHGITDVLGECRRLGFRQREAWASQCIIKTSNLRRHQHRAGGLTLNTLHRQLKETLVCVTSAEQSVLWLHRAPWVFLESPLSCIPRKPTQHFPAKPALESHPSEEALQYMVPCFPLAAVRCRCARFIPSFQGLLSALQSSPQNLAFSFCFRITLQTLHPLPPAPRVSTQPAKALEGFLVCVPSPAPVNQC